MATMATTTSTVTPIAGSKAHLLQNRPSGVSVLGLPAVSMKGRVKCMAEEKSTGKSASHLSTICAAAAAVASTIFGPATALVDERMSTEGMGLPSDSATTSSRGSSWGMFGLIWAFYVTYASALDEEEESGLSL